MTARHASVAALVVVFCLVLAGNVGAQTSTGSVAGRVVDQQAAVIPGAEVTLSHQLTGSRLTTVTDRTGTFLFPSVPPGVYRVAITLQNFKTLERTDLALTASERLFVGTLVLELGIAAETVTVSAEGAPIVQLSSQERSAVLDDKQLTQMSAQGRDYLNLLKLLPGVSYPDGAGSQALGTSSAPIINGVRGDYVALNLDGVVANNRGLGTTENMLNLDAIAEVKVLQSNYQAEYGKNAGAIVNVITKNGTRVFRGSGYWYKRHERFNANDYFNNLRGQPKGRYRYNTVGYNLGGPIFFGSRINPNKDKLFFFFSQEIQPNTRPSTRTYTFPTERERRGDFSQSIESNGSLIVVKDPLTGLPFANNVIPTDRINPNTQKLLGVFPLPNFSDRSISQGAYNHVVTDSVDNPVHQEVLRIDYTPSPAWRFSARGMAMSVKTDGLATTANSNQWGVRQTYETSNPNVALNIVWLPQPTLVNELSVGYSAWSEVQRISDSELAKLQRDRLGITLRQFNPSLNPLNLIPTASFGGVTGAASIGYDGRFPMDNKVYAYSVADGLSKVIGPHNLKAGLYFEYAEYLQRHHGSNFTGSFNFGRSSSNPYDSNHPYANALLGNFQSYTEVTSRVDYQPINQVFEWYAQDNWKVGKRLTLDYGVRFTYDIPPYQRHDVAANFDPALYDRARAPVMFVPVKDAKGKRVAKNPLTGQLFPEAYIGYFVPGSGNPYIGTVQAGDADVPRGFVKGNGVMAAPRLGFALDPFGSGKTAVRGGFGIFYNARPRSGQMGDMSFNPPLQARPTQFYGNVDSFLNATTLLAPSSFNRVIGSSSKMLRLYQMSLGVQRDLFFNTVLDVAYSGNIGRNLGQTRQINNVPYGARFLPENQDPTTGKPLPDNFFRPYTGYAGMPLLEFTGTSSYHSLQTQLKHRFSRGVQFSVAWTLSKAMNYGDAYDDDIAAFNDPKFWNYGPAGFDRRHTFVANWLWDLPKASRLVDHPIVRAVFDHWQLSGVYSYVTGSPRGVSMTLTDGADLTGGGDGVTVLMNGSAVLPAAERTFERYYNTSVFARPARGTIGSGAAATRNAFRGPGINNLDLTFFKNIPVRGRVSAQLRWEMYNALNHTQFNGVDASARFNAAGEQVNTRFGQITSARSPRIQQLALRVTF